MYEFGVIFGFMIMIISVFSFIIRKKRNSDTVEEMTKLEQYLVRIGFIILVLGFVLHLLE